ncbi:MAG: hypothetical protein OXC38_04240 [Gammaproteobacteria bacterium]|nr:hypothetical protein [Gammaproteobacteria bacterium]
MHLSWNEMRARAAAFAEEWKDARYEKGETQSFYNEFFEVFGIRRLIARWTGYIAQRGLAPGANASSIFLCFTRECLRPLQRQLENGNHARRSVADNPLMALREQPRSGDLPEHFRL